MVERGRHPRFALGESTTPLANLSLQRLAGRYEFPELRDLATYGRWRKRRPELERGLKRGFTFWWHRPGQRFDPDPAAGRRLLVAASPDDELADTHWLRADVDAFLAARARDRGVELRENTEVVDVVVEPGGMRLELASTDNRGPTEAVRAGFVVDASGRAGVVSQTLGAERRPRPARFRSGLLFSHLEGVEAAPPVLRGAEPGPYAEFRAAVHHFVDEGWIYLLPFDGGVTSVGLVTIDREARAALSKREPKALWTRVVARYPTLAEVFETARPIRPWRSVPELQYRRERPAGVSWAALPHAYAFFEPLFSTGIAWTLIAVERLSEILCGDEPDTGRYAALLAAEADQIERLVHGAYLARERPGRAIAHALLYFSLVSFAEVEQRMLLERRERAHWSGFLGGGRPEREALLDEACRRLAASDFENRDESFERWIRRAIEPWNLAGLAEPGRRNLYPVDLDAVVRGAHLLGLSQATAIERLPLLLA